MTTDTVTLLREHGHHGRTVIRCARALVEREHGPLVPGMEITLAGTTFQLLMASHQDTIEIPAPARRAQEA